MQQLVIAATVVIVAVVQGDNVGAGTCSTLTGWWQAPAGGTINGILQRGLTLSVQQGDVTVAPGLLDGTVATFYFANMCSPGGARPACALNATVSDDCRTLTFRNHAVWRQTCADPPGHLASTVQMPCGESQRCCADGEVCTRGGSCVDAVAVTPPMGLNTWNSFGCDLISAQVLMAMADQMSSLGLKAVGYTYINSDDCWMTHSRSNGGAGPQVPDPVKFPQGMRPVADYIHSKGLKLGLYTALAPHTCGGYIGSCDHELIDVAQWANWTVDYMKDDYCGSCGRPVEVDYGVMASAIADVGRPMVLSIEGLPKIQDVYTGCCGNSRRVGHDIGPRWLSMTTLVDVGSGLWKYAHNGSLTAPPNPAAGFWNDLVGVTCCHPHAAT